MRKSPYELLLLAAFALMLVIIFSPVNDPGLQIKTMFSVPLETMIWVIPVLLITVWLLYLLTRKFLYLATLSRVHIFTTVFATILMMTVILIGTNPTPSFTKRYELIGNAVQLSTLLFLSVQLIYFGNIVSGLLLKNKAH